MKQRFFKYLAAAMVIVIIAISFIPMSGVSASQIPYVTNGLEAYYLGSNNTGSGQNTSATTWSDLSGKGNHITDLTKNSTNYFSDKAFVVNTAKTFFPQAVVDVVNGQEFTVELVLGAFTSLNNSFNTFINSGNDNFALFRRVPGDFIEFKNNTNERPKVEGGEEYFKNSTVTITYKVGGKVRMYVDGVLLDEKNAVLAVNADTLWFGHDLTSRNFEAEYLAMRFYSVELTAAQVLANHNTDLTVCYGQGEISADPSDDPSDELTDDPSDDPSDEPSDEPSDDVSSDTSSAAVSSEAVSQTSTVSGDSSAPPLGDSGAYLIYALIAVVAVVVVVASLYVRKKRA